MKVSSSLTSSSSSSKIISSTIAVTVLMTVLLAINNGKGSFAYDGLRRRHGHLRDLSSSLSSSTSSDIVAFWYKPHTECGTTQGSTPQAAADFINEQMMGASSSDFVGIAEWQAPADEYPLLGREGDDDKYGIIGGVCGYNMTDISWTTPQVLFYNKQKWTMDKSYPSSSQCNFVPTSPYSNDDPLIGDVCNTRTTPGDDTCCTCVFSEEEYLLGNQMGLPIYERPWVAGLFTHNDNPQQQVCVITAQFPHPLANTTLQNLDGQVLSATGNEPYTIQKYLCTDTGTENCIPNLSNTSKIEFGSDNLVVLGSEFCGPNTPIIFMADTNVGPGYVDTGLLFNEPSPLSKLTDYEAGQNPYTCCNDTVAGNGFNTYSNDRLAVSTPTLKIDLLEGGSVAPRGPVTDPTMGYHCHSKEEHLPLRAHISFH